MILDQVADSVIDEAEWNRAEATTFYLGAPRGTGIAGIARHFPGGEAQARACLAYLTRARWLPDHVATPPDTCVELSMDFEAATGRDIGRFVGVRRGGIATGLPHTTKLTLRQKADAMRRQCGELS